MIITFVKYTSASYFLYDLIHTIKDTTSTMNVMNLGFMFHHIACITALDYYDLPPYQSYFVDIFLYSEISNILMYIVYHLLHTTENKHSNTIFTLQTAQTVLYVYLRGFVLFRVGWNLTTDPNVSQMVYGLWSVYVIGLVWGYKLCNQLLNNMRLKFPMLFGN